MAKGKRGGFPWLTVLLVVVLLVAIIATTTILLGRNLGYWEYADLPVIGRLFPVTAPAEPPAENGSDAEDPLAGLEAELARRVSLIAELEQRLAEQEREISRLQSQVDILVTEAEAREQAGNRQQLLATANILENMRAEQAAEILKHYPDEDILALLVMMPSEVSGAILARFDPQRAAQVTALPR